MKSQQLRNRIYMKAASKWGVESQIVVALEECAELSVELAKVLNNKHDPTHGRLIDELADVRIMIEQMELNFGCADLVEMRRDVKVTRLNDILDGKFDHPHKPKITI